MPEAISVFAACAVGSDIFVFSGIDGIRDQASVFKYDTLEDVWSTLAPMPLDCSFHSASVLDGLVYIVGAGDMNKDILRFDPASGVWSPLTATLLECFRGSSFVLGGCLCAMGGTEAGYPSSVERYDVVTNTWTALADLLEGRRNFGAVTTAFVGLVEEQDLFDVLIAKAAGEWPHWHN
jgi:hypothetical protein